MHLGLRLHRWEPSLVFRIVKTTFVGADVRYIALLRPLHPSCGQKQHQAAGCTKSVPTRELKQPYVDDLSCCVMSSMVVIAFGHERGPLKITDCITNRTTRLSNAAKAIFSNDIKREEPNPWIQERWLRSFDSGRSICTSRLLAIPPRLPHFRSQIKLGS